MGRETFLFLEKNFFIFGKKLKKKEGIKFWRVIETAFSLGMSISIPIAGGAILGIFLDKKFDTHPRLTLSLLFAGIFVAGGAIWNVIKETKSAK